MSPVLEVDTHFHYSPDYVKGEWEENKIDKQIIWDKKLATFRTRQRQALFFVLFCLLIWLAVYTAVGASDGTAFGKPTNLAGTCKQLRYFFYYDGSECQRMLDLPQRSPPTRKTQRVLYCIGRDLNTSEEVNRGVYQQTITEGYFDDFGASGLWSYEILRFSGGPLKDNTVSFAGFGILYYQLPLNFSQGSSLNQTIGVIGGYGTYGSYMKGGSKAFRGLEEPKTRTFVRIDLNIC